MIINVTENFEMENLPSNEFITNEFNKRLKYVKENIPDLITFLKKSPKKFIALIENNQIIKDIEKGTLIKIFYYTCNLLKEIEIELIFIGLRIMDYFVDYIPEEYLLNAFIFEKQLSKKLHVSSKKKFVSVGDYELAKFDTNLGMNYGFFASALEEEKKEIKIKTLQLISRIGINIEYKEFAIKSFKYTIELINDEEDEVRFETIRCLELLISNFKKIEIKSLEIVFFNLKEKSSELRKLLYSLSSKISNINFEEFDKTRKVLIENLKLFAEDKILIFGSLKSFFINNLEFVTNEYILTLLEIDSNFLTSEYNWNDLIYNSSLILLQEYIKANNYNTDLIIPTFMGKHFNYLSDRFPKIFDKNVYLYISINHKVKNIGLNEMIIDSIPFQSDFKLIPNIDEILKFLKTSSITNSNHSILEIYHYIFSFLNIFIFNTFLSITELLIAIDKIVIILELINFKINLEANIKNFDLYYLNNYIMGFLMINLCKHLDISDISKYKFFDIMNQSIESLKLKNKFKSLLMLTENNTSVSLCLEENLKVISNDYNNLTSTSLINVKITNPKLNFNYIHIKNRDGLKYPFFLQVSLKIQKICIHLLSQQELFLSKNLVIIISKPGEKKRVDLDPSNISLVEVDNLISVKSKVPIILDENEEALEYNINAYIKSIFACDLTEILNFLNILTVHHSHNMVSLSEKVNFIITY